MADSLERDFQIVVIDDEPFFQELVRLSLAGHQVTAALDGSELETHLAGADLLILDINLGKDSGYNVSRKARSLNSDIPILFLSSMQDLEARLKAYGSGGDDYITKPFQQDELLYKVKALASNYRKKQELTTQLQERSLLLREVQRVSSDINVINRFCLLGSQCKDFDALLQIFFHTLDELGLQGLIAIDGRPPRSNTQSISRLEKEILDLGGQLPRIHCFGQQRAIFNWGACRLLIRAIGPHIDTAAILMDALEVSLKRIGYEEQLVEQIIAIEAYNSAMKNRLSDILELMKDQVSDELLNLGVVASLSWEEEERIKQVLETFAGEFQAIFLEQEANNHKLRQATERLREMDPRFREQLDNLLHQDDDVLF